MEVELTDHLGYEPHEEPPGGPGTRATVGTPKTLVTEHGPVAIKTPRDRDGSFEPKMVRKRQRRFEGFDEKILALYSRGHVDARHRGAPARALRRQRRPGPDLAG